MILKYFMLHNYQHELKSIINFKKDFKRNYIRMVGSKFFFKNYLFIGTNLGIDIIQKFFIKNKFVRKKFILKRRRRRFKRFLVNFFKFIKSTTLDINYIFLNYVSKVFNHGFKLNNNIANRNNNIKPYSFLKNFTEHSNPFFLKLINNLNRIDLSFTYRNKLKFGDNKSYIKSPYINHNPNIKFAGQFYNLNLINSLKIRNIGINTTINFKFRNLQSNENLFKFIQFSNNNQKRIKRADLNVTPKANPKHHKLNLFRNFFNKLNIRFIEPIKDNLTLQNKRLFIISNSTLFLMFIYNFQKKLIHLNKFKFRVKKNIYSFLKPNAFKKSILIKQRRIIMSRFF